MTGQCKEVERDGNESAESGGSDPSHPVREHEKPDEARGQQHTHRQCDYDAIAAAPIAVQEHTGDDERGDDGDEPDDDDDPHDRPV
jgi:hypothetical protein